MNKNVPKIRFQGFHDDWEQRKFFDNIQKVVDFRGRTPKKIGMNWNNNSEGYLALSALNVKNGYIDLNSEAHYGSAEMYEKWMNGNDLHEGQVLFTTEAPMGNVAQVPDNRGYILSQRTIAFEVEKSKITENFLATLLRSPSSYNRLLSLSSGGTAKGVSQKSLQQFEVTVPTNLMEQTKIGKAFEGIDNLITLHQRKLNLLKLQKKSLLQKMLPQKDEKNPNIRFINFIDDWKNYKLGAILSERKTLISQSQEYPLVSFTVEHGVTPKTDRYNREQLVTGDKVAKKYKLTKLDDIVYNPANLKFGAINRNTFGNAVFSPIYITFEVNEKLVFSKFIELFVTRDRFIKKALKYQQGTVFERQSVSVEDMLNLNLGIPSLTEQRVFSMFFNKIDNLIVLHQRKLDALQEQKKGLLQKMFV